MHPALLQVSRIQNFLEISEIDSKAEVIVNNKKSNCYFQSVYNHFSDITIQQYRKLHNVKVKNLSQVNIFAGTNNMGKTTLLEAVYLLSQLNDINAFFSLEKYSGRFTERLNTRWLDATFNKDIVLSGIFNDIEVSNSIEKQSTDEDIDKANYLSTLKIQANIADHETLYSLAHLYGDDAPKIKFRQSQTLCPATFSSPYRYNYDLLLKAHAHAVDNKSMDMVINFIKEHLDHSIEKIEIVTIEEEIRFVVTSSEFDEVMDITKYGEGLQRVFEIALLMAYSKDGIVCIDEIDSAIHKSLLIQFTKFIQELAQKFNVQVFLSTHSKECIDAFIQNDYQNDKLTAYSIVKVDDTIKCKYINGERLESLIESINFDIR